VRIKSIRIQNFRGFADATIPLEALTSFVGPNGAGKSTVLCALNMFFREPSNATSVDTLSAEDFHHCRTAERIQITLTFHELSPAAREALKTYVRQDELVVSAVAVFDEAKNNARIKQVGSVWVHPEFMVFHERYAQGALAPELNDLFNGLQLRFEGIAAAGSKDAKSQALRAYEAAHPDQTVPMEAEADFYGSGSSLLKEFVQWVYVPAVKNASEEEAELKNSALGKLLARTVRAQVNFRNDLDQLDQEMRRRYDELLQARQGALNRVSEALTLRMREWSHPDASVELLWEGGPGPLRDPTARAQAKEGEFQGAISRFGHGFQRSYLMALLQELSDTAVDRGPTLILGCEEPELYQHPPQARHLAYVLRTLADGNAQILLTTHSPHFVSGERFESVRMVRRPTGAPASSVQHMTFDDFAERYALTTGARPERPNAVAVRLNEALRPHINELFFARGVVLVEGSEDVAYLMAWMSLMDQLGPYRRSGLHVVPVDGKSNLARPLILAQQLGIPVFVVFDADGDCEEIHRPGHRIDNQRLLHLLGQPDADPFPTEIFWGNNFVVWPTSLATVVFAELKASVDPALIERLKEQARVKCGQASGLSKNSIFIQHVLEGAHREGAQSDTLRRWCAAVLSLV
jgi:predicted ATP-dependent endonuclease of OLD family